MTVLNVYLIVIVYFLSCPKIESSVEYQAGDANHEKTKYFREENDLLSASSKWDKYIKLIENAEQNYVNQTDDSNRSIFRSQIDQDFSYWRNQSIDEIQKQLTTNEITAKTHRLTLYQIINHRLYRQTEDQLIFPARNYGIEHFLLNIIDSLPDMEFLLNTYDWPQSLPNIPILSFSKSLLSHNTDILYPAWAFWDGGPALGSVYPTGIGRWDIMRQTLNKARQKLPWSKKESRGFFRGSRTSSERDPLVFIISQSS